jgi:hypothetical protein
VPHSGAQQACSVHGPAKEGMLRDVPFLHCCPSGRSDANRRLIAQHTCATATPYRKRDHLRHNTPAILHKWRLNNGMHEIYIRSRPSKAGVLGVPARRRAGGLSRKSAEPQERLRLRASIPNAPRIKCGAGFLWPQTRPCDSSAPLAPHRARRGGGLIPCCEIRPTMPPERPHGCATFPRDHQDSRRIR